MLLGFETVRLTWFARLARIVMLDLNVRFVLELRRSEVSLMVSSERCIALALALSASLWLPAEAAAQGAAIPRTPDGKPNLQGIWQVRNRAAYGLEDHHARHGMPPGRSVVEGGTIPYQSWAAAKRAENFANRQTADPLAKCYMPGVPRIMYMEHPFQIFQTPEHIAMLFEWSQVHRLVYLSGRPPLHPGIDSWMGDSRGRWEGDTLVVTVTGQNDRTWLDMSGNVHSAAVRMVERYTLRDADTLTYEVTIEDPKVFTRPWKISMPLYRHKDMDRVLEYQCLAEAEEANGLFEREPRTWYPEQGVSGAPGGANK
jgi:hypothetical protein